MFKPKFPQQEQGFTLIEVLVAILLVIFFVAAAMQGMLSAAIFKARAQQYAEATNWIQADLENVKYQAASFQYTSLTANAASGASSINVASVADFAVNDTLKVGSDPGTYTISSIIGTTLTITPSLGTAQSQIATVSATKRCNPAAPNAGFADGLRDKFTGSIQTGTTNAVNIPKTSNRTGKTFVMTRTTTLSSAAPYNVLQVSYDVSPTPGGSSVAKLYTEVIPNAALQCP